MNYNNNNIIKRSTQIDKLQ